MIALYLLQLFAGMTLIMFAVKLYTAHYPESFLGRMFTFTYM